MTTKKYNKLRAYLKIAPTLFLGFCLGFTLPAVCFANSKTAQTKPAAQSDDQAVVKWMETHFTEVFNYNYQNYVAALSKLKYYFTKSGYIDFLNALDKSNNLSYLVQEKMTLNAEAKGPATLIKSEIIEDHYAWSVEMPVVLTYKNDSSSKQQYLLANVLIIGNSLTQYEKNKIYRIERMVLTPIKSN